MPFSAIEEALGRELTAAEVEKVEQLAVSDWTNWLDEGQPLPYASALERMRMLVPDILPEVPSEAVLTACFGLGPTDARKLRRDFIADRGKRRTMLKKALKVLDTATVEDVEFSIVEVPDFLTADLDERAEKARQAMGDGFYTPKRRSARPRPGFYEWRIEKETLVRIKSLL